ncbi:MAG: SemiSWEET family transporter [Patescibacteria group bacterium]|nr:SemiSWEET family transporter [Patescibacteria group bacterium]
MNWLEISRFFTVIASLAITFGVYVQSYKIWKTKSAGDFTFILIIALVFNEVAWLNYGIALREWPIILISSLNIPGIVATAIGYIKYK